jgi:flagellar FliL protein
MPPPAKPGAKEPAAAAAPAAAAPEKPPAAEKEAHAPSPAASRFNVLALVPALMAVVLAPAASWAVAEFVLLPRLQKKLAAPPPAEAAAAATPAAASEGGENKAHGGKECGAANAVYEFPNVVVNLAGTMGTRYLKTTFVVTGADANIKSAFEANKARLTDITLSVLSSLTLADLEEPGAKNVLREKLVSAYNQALGHRVADQVYFSDFVIQ